MSASTGRRVSPQIIDCCPIAQCWGKKKSSFLPDLIETVLVSVLLLHGACAYMFMNFIINENQVDALSWGKNI